MANEKLNKRSKTDKIIIGLILLEGVIFSVLFFSIFIPYADIVLAVVGSDNVTVTTSLTVGAVAPEILNITINDYAASIDLTANATTTIYVYIIARDYNGEGNIQNISVEFFDNSNSSYGSGDDNNNHYTNSSCNINTSYGNAYEVNATCTFAIEYYANNATWNATANATDMRKKAERIDTVVKSLIEKLDKQSNPTSDEIEGIWKEVAGKKAFAHTKPTSLRKKRLVINVDGSSWLYELTMKKEEFLAALRKRLGKDKINEVQFRIGEL